MTATNVRTYEKKLIDKLVRKRRKEIAQTESITSTVDAAIKLLAEKEGVK